MLPRKAGQKKELQDDDDDVKSKKTTMSMTVVKEVKRMQACVVQFMV